jgi:hypothetical protein
MKRLIAPLAMGALLATSVVADDSLKAEIEALKAQMAELKKAQESINVSALQKQLTEVKAHTAGDNIKWSVDFRTAYDIVDYKVNSTPHPLSGAVAEDVDNSLWTNKLILGMAAQPVDNLVFKGALGVYKAFGANSAQSYNPYQNMDWYATQTPSGDANIRLREAYFLYFGQMGDVKYTASFGRRPSVDGFLTNLREDNAYPASPVGHNINMEFDGASFKFDFDKVTGISGLYFKLCLGRGNSNADTKYPGFTTAALFGGVQPSATNTPYINSTIDSPNMDLAGLLVQLYDNGQYKVMANYFKGWNMMGASFGPANASGYYPVSMVDVGDMTGGSLSLQVNGIGNEINDFLDDSIFFISYAFNKTDPNSVTVGTFNPNTGAYMTAPVGMLGSLDSETGYSYYAGLNVPGFFESDRIGLEYNHGSKYWRSFTYGEDTLAGSKLSTRGDAYELYYNFPLVDKYLTAQIRYTYMDYDYTGSDMFFGQTGAPMDVDTTPGAVESASNIRLSLRYRY